MLNHKLAQNFYKFSEMTLKIISKEYSNICSNIETDEALMVYSLLVRK